MWGFGWEVLSPWHNEVDSRGGTPEFCGPCDRDPQKGTPNPGNFLIGFKPRVRRVRVCVCCPTVVLIWGFPELGVPFWGPYNGDYSTLGSLLQVPRLSGNYQLLLFHSLPTLNPKA